MPGRTWGLQVRRTPDGPLVPYLQGRGVGGGASINGGLLELPTTADEARLGWPGLRARAEQSAASLGSTVEPGVFDRAVMAAAPLMAVSPALLARRDGRRAIPGTSEAVRAGAVVDRVLVDGRRAAGVRLAGGDELEADLVVIAAGALATPILLAHSGIEVEGLGEGLRDHAAVTLSLGLRPEARLPSPDTRPTGLTLRAGDAQLVPLGLTGPGEHGLDTAAVLGIHLGGHGRGQVRLGEITFDALSDERDRAALRALVRVLARLARAPAITALAESATLGSDGTPLDQANGTDDELDAWLVGHLAEVYHPAGTCSAGVVTDRLGRVIGYEGLVVVDASVLPELPRVAPQLTVMAVADVLADQAAAR